MKGGSNENILICIINIPNSTIKQVLTSVKIVFASTFL